MDPKPNSRKNLLLVLHSVARVGPIVSKSSSHRNPIRYRSYTPGYETLESWRYLTASAKRELDCDAHFTMWRSSLLAATEMMMALRRVPRDDDIRRISRPCPAPAPKSSTAELFKQLVVIQILAPSTGFTMRSATSLFFAGLLACGLPECLAGTVYGCYSAPGASPYPPSVTELTNTVVNWALTCDASSCGNKDGVWTQYNPVGMVAGLVNSEDNGVHDAAVVITGTFSEMTWNVCWNAIGYW